MGILASTSLNSNYPPCSCSCRQAVLYFHHSTPTGHARAHRQAAHLFYIAIRSLLARLFYIAGSQPPGVFIAQPFYVTYLVEHMCYIWVSAHIRTFVPGGYARKWIWLPCTLYKPSTGYDNNIITTLSKGIKPPYFTRSWHISIVTIKAI